MEPEDFQTFPLASLENEDDLARLECELQMQRIIGEAWKDFQKGEGR